MRIVIDLLLFIFFTIMGFGTALGFINPYSDGALGKQGIADFFNYMEGVIPGFNAFCFLLVSGLCGVRLYKSIERNRKDEG